MEVKRLGVLVLSVFLMLCFGVFAVAEDGISVEGKYYEFSEKNEYEISSAKDSLPTSKSDTYGDFLLEGKIESTGTKNGVAAYTVEGTNLNLIYKYDDSLLNADIDSWHLREDKTKKIDGYDIGEKIQKGAILVQTSIDHINWSEVICLPNAFDTIPIRSNSFYEAKEIELVNGCYYRIFIVYELGKRIEDSDFLFIDTDKYDYKKCAEVYEFYSITAGIKNDGDGTLQTHNIGEKVRVKEFDGYYGEEEIDNNDIHYGWEIGNFFVSGYTDKRKNDDGELIFLKNLDDKVTLWFNLQQEINRIKGNSKLSVTSDSKGYDKYFETERINFGRGALIVRHIDYNNNKTTQIYTNYLEANTSLGANTKVQLFEEGDYEVALDYEITQDGLIDTEGHYRIFFKFSVRNGNCMVYPIDVATGSELMNTSFTENGFTLNLAKSRYLKVNVKKEVLTEGADGLAEDTRFNIPTKDGAKYTDEGIYTITVSNDYTQQETEKKIYVGTNSILKAHVTSGLSVREIKNYIENGATITDAGIIIFPDEDYDAEETKNDKQESMPFDENTKESKSKSVESNNILIIVLIIIIVFLVIVVVKSKIGKRLKSKGEDE